MTNEKQLKLLINAAIANMRDVPVIDAENVAQHALLNWPQDTPRPIGLKQDLEKLADEILRQRFDPTARIRRTASTTASPKLVDQYFAALRRIGTDDFWHPDLEAIRQRMSDDEMLMVRARLKAEAEVAFAEAEALKKFGERKFGVNDNSEEETP